MRPRRLFWSILAGITGTILTGFALAPLHPGNFHLPVWAANPVLVANHPAFLAGVVFGRGAYHLVAFVQWFLVSYAVLVMVAKNKK